MSYESVWGHHSILKLILLSITWLINGFFYPPNYPPYVFGFWPTLALNNFLCNARPHARQCVLVSTEALVRIAGWGLSVRIFDASACCAHAYTHAPRRPVSDVYLRAAVACHAPCQTIWLKAPTSLRKCVFEGLALGSWSRFKVVEALKLILSNAQPRVTENL